jgi:cytochrome c-type biogenesis protein CcmH/NrfG
MVAMLLALPALLTTAHVAWASDEMSTELLSIQRAWEQANYEAPNADAKAKSLEQLSARAQAFVQRFPGHAEPLIWQGIVLSTYAGAKGGLGALSLAKKSRDSLLAALKLDPAALDGSAYTSLGALYYKVPGWPIGFGDKDKAAEFLRKGLEQNPDGIDPNSFYGEFMFEQKKYTDALRYLEKARSAPARPERPLADSGRRAEVEALITRVRAAS